MFYMSHTKLCTHKRCVETHARTVYRSIETLTKQNKNHCRETAKEKGLRWEVGERLAKPHGVRWRGGGFDTVALLLVDISKVKLLKGNSTSKTNRKWALGWLTGRSGVGVCVPGVCIWVFSARLQWSHCLTCQVAALFGFDNTTRVQVFECNHLRFLTWQIHTWLSF